MIGGGGITENVTAIMDWLIDWGRIVSFPNGPWFGYKGTGDG